MEQRHHRRLVACRSAFVMQFHLPDQQEKQPDQSDHGQQSSNPSQHVHGNGNVCAGHRTSELEDDLSERLARLENPMPLGDVGERKHAIDDGTKASPFDEFHHLMQFRQTSHRRP
jgi:hypothetical protein